MKEPRKIGIDGKSYIMSSHDFDAVVVSTGRKMNCDAIKCDVCGKFIAYADLDEGKAIHHMSAPDSHFGSEQWETLCKKCRIKESEQHKVN